MILCLEQISKRYPGSDGARVALDNVSLELDRGQIIGIFGPSGGGKTTLLRIAAGLQSPDSGAVIYNGVRLDQMSPTERKRIRRREIACIWSTHPGQERLKVLEHVAMPLLVDHCDHRSAERRAHKALLACEAERCADMELHQLSDGERQRVAVARALVSEPRLLLADGPASRLSIVEQEGIMVLLSSLAREAKVGVLITDSNAEALLRAEPIMYLRDGKIIDPEPVSERGRVYRFPSERLGQAASDA